MMATATPAAPSDRPGDRVAEILIDDPKIHIEEHCHDHPVTGQLVRLLTLLAPVDRWERLPAFVQARWTASQVGRTVQAHRILFC